MRLLQVLASSDANIPQRLIMTRCTEIDGSYIDFPPLPKVVTVLDSQGYHKRMAQPYVWCQYKNGPFGYGQTISD